MSELQIQDARGGGQKNVPIAQREAPKVSEIPGKPAQDAVLVSNMTRGMFAATAAAIYPTTPFTD